MEGATGRKFKDMEEAHEYRRKGLLKRFKNIVQARKRLQGFLLNQRRVSGVMTSYLRPKMVSWKSGAATPSILTSAGLAWQRQFAFLNARHEKFMGNRKHPGIRFGTRYHLPTLVKKRLIEQEDSVVLRTSWEIYPSNERRKYWPELMHMTLADYPDSALKVLVATYHEPYPPNYAVSDCVNFTISHYFRQRSVKTKEKDGAKILDIIFHLLRSGPPNYIRLNQNSTHLLIKNLDLAQVQYMYQELEGLGHVFHENTLIHFAHKFAKLEEMDLAFDILERLQHEGVDFSSTKMNTLCSTLLEWKHRAAKDIRSDDEIFKFMLESGLQPNIIHYNILIQNACQKGDHSTGWQIHDMLLENDISANQYTYSILLNDAKSRLDESDIQRVMDMIGKKRIFNSLTVNSHIVTDLLHATFLLHQKYQDDARASGQKFDGPSAFDKMLPRYCYYFDIETLARIIPDFHEKYPSALDYETQYPATTSHKKSLAWKPEYPTLIVMITVRIIGAGKLL
jgi:pentatricopeptide repeat protein